jgi:hypothetical protein
VIGVNVDVIVGVSVVGVSRVVAETGWRDIDI